MSSPRGLVEAGIWAITVGGVDTRRVAAGGLTNALDLGTGMGMGAPLAKGDGDGRGWR